MHCTCGPHPHIDLTAAYFPDGHGAPTNGDDDAAATAAVSSACRSHGCFHVTIDLPPPVRPSIECLCKPSQRIEEEIESLFSAPFLQKVVAPASNAAPIHHVGGSAADVKKGDDICNGGFFEVPFPVASLPSMANEAENRPENNTTSATFRGRVAESGDERQSTPEPKLSWEFRRCIAANNSHSSPSADTVDLSDRPNGMENEKNDTIRKDDDVGHHAWSLLPKWTEALHSIASTIIRLMDIPPQLALQEHPCSCCVHTGEDRTCRGSCNIDLLRVFRYDALPANDQAQTMGSSAHSDWGTLTVVWQDSKGGLQTYCHDCDAWSDVDASPDTATRDEGASHRCSVFVHVGDFLSLATIGGEKGGARPWPSPRHRVLCPVIPQNSNRRAEGADCRRSLVYFAYPPPGVSLDDARKVVAPIASRCLRTDEPSHEYPAECYDGYSLLHNQSQQSTTEEGSSGMNREDVNASPSILTHSRIRGIPFNRVISDKWSQVQMKA